MQDLDETNYDLHLPKNNEKRPPYDVIFWLAVILLLYYIFSK